MPHANKVFCALDTPSLDIALGLANRLKGTLGGMKLGLEFFGAQGPAGIRRVAETGMPIFLDLKFHDIPNTVASAVKSLKGRPCSLLTIHACGGPEMLARAADAAKSTLPDCTVLGVTVLTSMDQAQLSATGVARTPEQQVRLLGRMAIDSGIGGLVCSPLELPVLRADLGRGPTLVTPGIRYPDAAGDDQNRIMTPAQAAAAGASFIVVGRPILKAKDPAAETLRIRRDIGETA